MTSERYSSNNKGCNLKAKELNIPVIIATGRNLTTIHHIV